MNFSKPILLYVINSFDGGGAESGLFTMVKGGLFADTDLKIVSLVRGAGGIEAKLEELGFKPTILIDAPRMRNSHLPLIFMRLKQLMARIRPRVVIASLPQANICARAIAMFRNDVVFISFEHNSHLAKRVYEIGYRLTSRRVDWAFADADTTLRTALERLYRRAPARQTVVPLVSFAPRARRKNPLSQSTSFHVINAARFTAVKNQRSLIEALAKLGANVRLTLYGDGPTREECMALAIRLGVAERVSFPGFVADWADRQADLFVLSSRHEGLCIVVLEAMNARIPVVAPMIGGLRDYVQPGFIRELRTVDPEEIASVIAAAIADQAAGERMAQAAGGMVDARFGSDAVQRLYGDINRALITSVRIG